MGVSEFLPDIYGKRIAEQIKQSNKFMEHMGYRVLTDDEIREREVALEKFRMELNVTSLNDTFVNAVLKLHSETSVKDCANCDEVRWPCQTVLLVASHLGINYEQV